MLKCYILFVFAAISWVIWKARNRASFDKKIISAPSDIIYSACSFLRYWADLLKGLTKEDLIRGVRWTNASCISACWNR
uniref:Uncharacterized protein n=1 Tax=Arundo donax TaxID=35708 RepID=A0A0A9DW78_ARUDO